MSKFKWRSVGVDVDGCVSDHDLLFCEAWNGLEEHCGIDGMKISPDKLRPGWFSGGIRKLGSLKQQIMTAEYYERLPLAAGAAWVLQDMISDGVHVAFFTMRPDVLQGQTFAWLKSAGLSGCDVLFDARSQARFNLFRSGRFDAFVDDDPMNVTTLLAAGENPVIVPKHAYNEHLVGRFVMVGGIGEDGLMLPETWAAIKREAMGG